VLEELDDEGLEFPSVLRGTELVEELDDVGDLLEEIEEALEIGRDAEREGEAGSHGVLVVLEDAGRGGASTGDSERMKKSSRTRFRRTVIGIRRPLCSRSQTLRR